jgi:FkbM family methyltransferase
MNIKKMKRIYRFLFPKNYSETELFENRLKANSLITHFEKKKSNYLIEVNNTFNLILRSYEFSDYEVFEQIFNNREYDVVLKMMLMNFDFEKEKIVVDAGANVGYTSVFFSRYCHNVKIYGIERSHSNIEIYYENIKLLQKNANIKIYHRALSKNPSCTFKLEREFRDKKDWSITTKLDNSGEVKGVTVDEIIIENNLEYISLLKIDIEGAERFILNKENNLSFLKITEIIAIAIHDEFNCREKIYDVLIENSFFLLESGELTIGINKCFLTSKKYDF